MSTPPSLAHGKLQLLRRWQLASDLRDVGYDAAYVLPNSLKSALIPWMAKIPLRIGYTGESRYGLLNVRHANPGKKERPPMVGQYAALAYAPGAKLPFSTDGREGTTPLPVPRLESDPNEAARVSTRFNLDNRTPLVVFCPGAEYGPAKRWPPEHFAALAQIRRAVVSVCAGSSRSGRRKMRRSRRPLPIGRRTCATCAARPRSAKRAR